MSKNKEVEKEEVEVQEPEVSSEEEQSYDDEFDTMWGKSEEPADDEPSSEDDDDEEVEEPAQEEEDEEEQEVPKEASKPAEPAAAKPSDDPYSWINTLSEDVRERAKELYKEAQTHKGRSAAMNRRVNELQEELRRYEETRASEPAERKAQASGSAAPEKLEKLEQLKEDFPEFADALQEAIAFERREAEKRLQTVLEPLEKERAAKRTEQFNTAVSEGAAKIFNTAETGLHWKEVVNGADFRAWLDLQPKSVQTAARTPDPTEALFVLQKYEDDYQRAVKEMGLDGPVKEDKTEVSDETSRAEALKRKRKKQQEVNTSPASRPAETSRHGDEGDYEAMFNARWG